MHTTHPRATYHVGQPQNVFLSPGSILRQLFEKGNEGIYVRERGWMDIIIKYCQYINTSHSKKRRRRKEEEVVMEGGRKVVAEEVEEGRWWRWRRRRKVFSSLELDVT